MFESYQSIKRSHATYSSPAVRIFPSSERVQLQTTALGSETLKISPATTESRKNPSLRRIGPEVAQNNGGGLTAGNEVSQASPPQVQATEAPSSSYCPFKLQTHECEEFQLQSVCQNSMSSMVRRCWHIRLEREISHKHSSRTCCCSWARIEYLKIVSQKFSITIETYKDTFSSILKECLLKFVLLASRLYY